ncbi:SMI1/KNR4 family protein [Bartonella taylorii]|uniref:SMI1/KNR4 family protein n=1 Tax=Bartonella taylorii TaxID=33046 RepID=A0A9Q8YX56_BARTA|nr:SMI1/KNR4 family protein [Bartonella taylorii]USP02714.1 SMI1/KNR4 family protein [Bartonella taylorii]
MKTYTLADVTKLVEKYNDRINFGTADDGVDDVLIEKAEKTLGLQFTTSYKSFLKNYGGGEIGYEEIMSVYLIDFEIARSDDIVYNHLTDIKNGLAKPQQLVVNRTDFGETFYFDYTQFQDGECPLYLRFPPSDPQYYASNFYEFLCKRIIEHAGG